MKTNRNIHAISLKLFGNIHDSGQAFSASAHIKVPVAIKKRTRKIKYFVLFVFIIATFNILFTTQAKAACYPKFKIINDTSNYYINGVWVFNATQTNKVTTNLILPSSGIFDIYPKVFVGGQGWRGGYETFALNSNGMSEIANNNGFYPQYYILEIHYKLEYSLDPLNNGFYYTYTYANTCTFMTYTLH
jgi:hypothetical protein